MKPTVWATEYLTPDFRFAARLAQPPLQVATAYQQAQIAVSPQFGRMLRLDGVFMLSEQDEFFYHENLIHIPAISHPCPRRALIIGGGDGGAAEELLKHNTIEAVTLVEIDPGVIDLARQHFQSVHHGVFDHPKLTVQIGDGRAYLEATPAQFDLIILDLTDPSGPSQALYTVEFYALCRRHLPPDGLLALHTESPVTRPVAWQRILATLKTAFPVVSPYLVYVPLYGTLWGMAAASACLSTGALSPGEINQRLLERGVTELQYYNPATHLAAHALPNFVMNLLNQEAPPITGSCPLPEDNIPFDE
jgi:spermidine synthase